MRVFLSLLILLAATTARADETPSEDKAPIAWGKDSFQNRSRAEASKLAEDLLGEKSPTPSSTPDKNDNSSSK